MVATPELVNIQCESCHGHGGDHVGKPEIKTVMNARNVCTGCHNEEQTPDFDFEAFWARISHPPSGQTD